MLLEAPALLPNEVSCSAYRFLCAIGGVVVFLF